MVIYVYNHSDIRYRPKLQLDPGGQSSRRRQEMPNDEIHLINSSFEKVVNMFRLIEKRNETVLV